MAQGKPKLKLKETYAIGSELINATDGRRTTFDFMT